MGLSRVVRASLAAGSVALAGMDSVARAEPRPTQGGLWSFAPEDVVEQWDEGSRRVRVHYSVAGPNATNLIDEDTDGVPDFPQLAGRTTAAAMDHFTQLGFRGPITDSDDEEPLGGSGAFDLYLIDFGGAADGRFASDSCARPPCTGFTIVENDFSGYGYPSLESAIDIVVPHETFHAVQAAYGPLPTWTSEGTATWSERSYDPESAGFLVACNAYLAEHTRPIHRPPPGPVPAFAYGSALWWEFLAELAGGDILHRLLLEIGRAPTLEPEAVMISTLKAGGLSIEDTWTAFVRRNLAVGFRAGATPSYQFASMLEPVRADQEGNTLDFNARLYPLAAEYWRIDADGDAVYFGSDEGLPNAQFSLHPIAGFAADGAVGAAVDEWTVDEPGGFALFEGRPLPAGGYWIVATLPRLTEQSVRGRICVGPESHVRGCVDIIDPEDGGSGSSSGGPPTGSSGAQGSDTGFVGETEGDELTTGGQGPGPTSGASDPSGGSARAPDDPRGCRCSTVGREHPATALLWCVCLLLTRRRRA